MQCRRLELERDVYYIYMKKNVLPEAATVNTLTGDLSTALLEHARLLMQRYPESVDAYALCSALREIREFFQDDQGIPVSEAEAIDDALLDSVRGLIGSGYLQRAEVPPNDAVRNVLIGLASLRNW